MPQSQSKIKLFGCIIGLSLTPRPSVDAFFLNSLAEKQRIKYLGSWLVDNQCFSNKTVIWKNRLKSI